MIYGNLKKKIKAVVKEKKEANEGDGGGSYYGCGDSNWKIAKQ